MKKLLYTLLGCTLLLAGCNKDLAEHTPAGAPENNAALFLAPQHFYGTAYSDLVTKGVAQADKLWPTGSTITVKFLNDDFNMAAQVEEWAKEWEQYANITFDFVDPSQQADVRIGFDWNDNRWITWSYIGTDCLSNTDQGDATISYAFWDTATSEEKKGDVLRTFGQVLGLELEHRHLDFDPGWVSEARVRSYWGREIEDIPWEVLRHYVFDPLNRANTLQSDQYDPQSIMIWPFALQQATNTQKSFNFELSETDKAFIATLYPEITEQPIAVIIGSNHSLIFSYKNAEQVVLDYAGRRDTIAAFEQSSYNLIVSNLEEEFPVLRVYGNGSTMSRIYCQDVSGIDIAGCSGLEKLEFSSTLLTEIDLTANAHLKYVSLVRLPITELDLSHHAVLEVLLINTSLLENLDLSSNTALKGVYLPYNYCLQALDVSPLSQLETFECYSSLLTELDLSKNPRLKSFSLNDSPITELDFTHNPLLEQFSCNLPHLSRLDITHCTQLKIVSLGTSLLSEIDLSGCVSMTSFTCNNSQLQELDFSGNPALFGVGILNNPIVTDQAALVRMAETLPDCNRPEVWRGNLRLGNTASWNWISGICSLKTGITKIKQHEKFTLYLALLHPATGRVQQRPGGAYASRHS